MTPAIEEVELTGRQGFIIGAFLNVWLTDRLGFGKVRVADVFIFPPNG